MEEVTHTAMRCVVLAKKASGWSSVKAVNVRTLLTSGTARNDRNEKRNEGNMGLYVHKKSLKGRQYYKKRA